MKKVVKRRGQMSRTAAKTLPQIKNKTAIQK
jgi:hypothetical protein